MKRLFPLILLVFALVILGCEDLPPKTDTVDLSQAALDAAKHQQLGDGVRIEFITGTGPHRSREIEVQRKLKEFINSGKYEIVRVVTTRCNGEGAHLLSAEVYYRPKK